MRIIEIEVPIWHNRSIGVHEDRLDPAMTFIRILARNKKGDRYYPNDYYFMTSNKDKYPRDKRNSKLIVIPIEHLRISKSELESLPAMTTEGTNNPVQKSLWAEGRIALKEARKVLEKR